MRFWCSRFVRAGGLAFGLLGFFACGGGNSGRTFGAAPGDDDAGGGAPSTEFTPTDGGSGLDGLDPNGCSEASKLVYVMTYEGDLYSFAPADKKFKKIAPLDCGLGPDEKPIAMGVDRKGIAWVNIPNETEARLFRVDTADGKCSPTNIKGTFGGMGFSADKAGSEEETLYVFSSDPLGQTITLDSVDFAKEKIVTGPKVDNGASELTGTGDAKLFGFIIDSPDQTSFPPSFADLLSIAELDKSSAAASNKVNLKGVPAPYAPGYAFSFWGGDFYVYTAPVKDYEEYVSYQDLSDAPTTTVAKYSPSTGDIDATYMTNIGFHIVGAGVSTCAPLAAPH